MANTKNTKRALLASTMALILCFSMLLGTTYAWFTDSVTSGTNIIAAGNLDVELYHSDSKVTDEKVTGTTVLFDDVTPALWEPGAMAYEKFTIKNEGTLALKYQFALNVTNATVINGVSFADMLKVAVVDANFVYTRENIEAIEADKWSGLASFIDEGTLAAAANETFGLVIWWQPSENDNLFNMNNDQQGKTVSVELGVELKATQLTAEKDSFDENYDTDASLPEAITDARELAAALTANEKEINVTLYNNIDLPISSLGQITGGSGEYKLGGEDTESIVIDLNGHKLNITTTYWSNLGAKNPNATFTIKNGEMTSSQPTGTWNSYDLTFSNCNYVFENVIFDKAVAFDNAGKSVEMNNVTINETHDYYALWICAAGIDVEINGLTVNSDGRGIKIDEQYVNAPAKVTLSITDAVFNTAKKAAIIVKSAAGADITLNNVSIANVAADPFNAVWVDEDGAAYANLVTVTGGTVVVEGSADAPTATTVAANTTVSMDNNIFTAGGKTVINNAGTITISKPNLAGGDVVINGGAVKGSGYATGVQHANTVTYNNVTVIGEMCLYGEKVVFNNCTFELNNQYVWTYGAKEVEFNNCTFNTNGKAILVYNEGAGASKVTVKGCTFNATAGAKAGAIANQNCAAIEIDNFQSSGTGTAHVVITENNTYGDNFSGEWRIKNYVNGGAITVNGDEYTQIAVDGKLMTIDANKNVTVAN